MNIYINDFPAHGRENLCKRAVIYSTKDQKCSLNRKYISIMKTTRALIIILIPFFLTVFSFSPDGQSLKVKSSQKIPRLYEIAQPRIFPPMVPKYSDVVMRNLTFRPMNEKDNYNTIDQIKQFHATRIEWVYCYKFDDSERARIKEIKDLGVLFSGATSGSTMHTNLPRKSLEMKMLDGSTPVPPWMSKWDNPQIFGCQNNPGYMEAHLQYCKDLIDMGVDLIHRDEAFYPVKKGTKIASCFCDYCMSAFSEYLSMNYTASRLGINNLDNFNYKAYLISRNVDPKDVTKTEWGTPLLDAFLRFQAYTGTRFHTYISNELDKYAGRHVSRSTNNGCHWIEPYNVFEYALSETVFRDMNPETLYGWFKDTREKGKYLIINSPKTIPATWTNAEAVNLIRKEEATATASGGSPRVPVDVFDQFPDGSSAPRYFGSPSEYADIYGFIRAIPEYLEGFEDAAVHIKNFKDERFNNNFPFEITDASRDVAAIARCIPGNPNSPIAVHLIDWDSKGGFTIRLRNASFFPGQKIKVKLLTPAKYNEEKHREAEEKAIKLLPAGDKRGPGQAQAYKELVDVSVLTPVRKGDWTEIKIPLLNPWGILIVEK